MTIEPKRRFLEDKNAASRHMAAFGSAEMQDWIQIAWAQFCLRLPPSTSATALIDANSRRDGAKEFIEVLMSLSTAAQPRQPQTDNLDHTA